MPTLASALVAACASILLFLGIAHLVFTFHGPRLTPRDAELQAQMQRVSPVITRQTTMWKAWLGFNASHSAGLMLFGVLYLYLPLVQGDLLFGSVFLQALGLVVLLSYGVMARRYFFRTPLRAVMLATVLYALGLALRMAP